MRMPENASETGVPSIVTRGPPGLVSIAAKVIVLADGFAANFRPPISTSISCWGGRSSDAVPAG